MKRAFNHLLNEKIVYGMADGAYQIRKKDLLPITLSPEPVDAVFEVSKKSEFLTMELKIKVGGKLLTREFSDTNTPEQYIYAQGNTYYFVKSEKVAQMVASFPDNVKMVASYQTSSLKMWWNRFPEILK